MRGKVWLCSLVAGCVVMMAASGWAQTARGVEQAVAFTPGAGEFPVVTSAGPATIVVEDSAPETVRVVADAFAGDVARVTGVTPARVTGLNGAGSKQIILVGVCGHSALLDRLAREKRISLSDVQGKWESAVVQVVPHPFPGVQQALVVAGSDRRGASYALFTLSRAMGVSPWVWWADVPVRHHAAVYVRPGEFRQREPSVKYRAIFLNDEDWGLRPWASHKMDPELHNIGPHTYARIFELLLRLKANSLWPAMHPGTLAFNAVPENAKLADKWGIVMGSSHSEALLRNNVGEWDEKRDGPWNYQVNKKAIDAYWDQRLQVNGKYENFYTVGMRGVHDSGLEATGTVEQKARLVEDVMRSQRAMLAKRVNPDLDDIPQVIWLYKESLELYRAGMRVPDDVTLGWTDDNYGYIRQLPDAQEQKRSGGSGMYYHVSYWGRPHDYLWLCTTPPALIREEMGKAYDRNVRRYWVLNVGDLKPAEMDIDYFMQLAWNEPAMSHTEPQTFIDNWFAEQLPPAQAHEAAAIMREYYRLSFIRKPEFMGFNGYDDAIKRTEFNPLAWGDQNRKRDDAWQQLSARAVKLEEQLPTAYHDAYFELVGYPVEAAAAQNRKLLATDRTYLEAARHQPVDADAQAARAAYDRIQTLTAEYNSLHGGKWDGMMSASPRERQVFRMPVTATAAQADVPLPSYWGTGTFKPLAKAEHAVRAPFVERDGVVSMNAADYTHEHARAGESWHRLRDLGGSGDSMEFGTPNMEPLASTACAPSSAALVYEFATTQTGVPQLNVDLLPTFPIDSQHRLRFAVSVDGGKPVCFDAAGAGEWSENSAPTWSKNVLRNYARYSSTLPELKAGRHVLRLMPLDPGLVFEHVSLVYPGAAPAYPVVPETQGQRAAKASAKGL